MPIDVVLVKGQEKHQDQLESFERDQGLARPSVLHCSLGCCVNLRQPLTLQSHSHSIVRNNSDAEEGGAVRRHGKPLNNVNEVCSTQPLSLAFRVNDFTSDAQRLETARRRRVRGANGDLYEVLRSSALSATLEALSSQTRKRRRSGIEDESVAPARTLDADADGLAASPLD